MDSGWIKLHRRILNNPLCMKDGDYFAVWVYLLLNATHKEIDVLFRRKIVTLKPGQLLTGRKSISKKFKIHESKVQRILEDYCNNTDKSKQQIEQQTSNQNRLITILKWSEYQESEQQNEQRANNERTTSEQRVNTNKNVKNVEKEKKRDRKTISFKKEGMNEGGKVDTSGESIEEMFSENNYKALRVMFKDYEFGWEDFMMFCEELLDWDKQRTSEKRYKDYPAALRNWIRRAIRDGKVDRSPVLNILN